jgi:predicted Zn-dependent protease
MTDRLQVLADQGDTLAREVTLPLVQGINAFAHGAYGEAIRLMAPLFTEPRLDQLARIGGSHAQREVFEDTMLEAYLRAEQFDKAEEMLRLRLQRRASVRDLLWLGRAQMSSGQPEAARASLDEVTQRWRDADPGAPERTTLHRLVHRLPERAG